MSDLAMHGIGKTRVHGIPGDFLIQAGTADITAGDFVNFVDGLKSSGQVYKAAAVLQASAESTAGYRYPAAVQLDTDKVMLLYQDSSNYGAAVIITFSGTTLTVGTELTFTGTTAVSSIAACLVDANKVLVTYRGASSTYYGVAIVLSVSGTTITAGTALTFAYETTSYHAVCKIEAGKAMAVYLGGSSSYGKAIVLSISDLKTITAGTALTFASEAIYGTACCLTDTNKIFVGYGGSTVLKFIVLSVSGTTVTAGTALATSSVSELLAVCRVDVNKLCAAYFDNWYNVIACVYTVSGTTITAGTALTVKKESGNYAYPSVVLTSANHVMLSWTITGGVAAVHVVLLTVATTTLTAGTITTLKTGLVTGRGASALLSTGKVMTAYYLSAAKIQVVDELTTTFNAVAKSSGTAGSTIRVYG